MTGSRCGLTVCAIVAVGLAGCEKRIVNVVPVDAVSISPTELTLLEGEGRSLQVTVTGPEGQSLQRDLTWSSNPTGVVSISNQGLLTAVAPGATTVSATTEGIRGSIPVTVLQGPTLSLSASSFDLSAPSGQVSSLVRTVDVTNSGNGTLSALSRSVVMDGAAGAGWLSASLSSTSTPAVLTISASAVNLEQGSYQGSVTVSDPSARNGDQTVSIDFTVDEALPKIVANTSAVFFSANAGTVQAATQDISIENGGGGAVVGLNASVSAGAPWLQAAFTEGTSAPTTLELTASAAQLAPGSYVAMVTVTSTSAADPVTIQVTFTVS